MAGLFENIGNLAGNYMPNFGGGAITAAVDTNTLLLYLLGGLVVVVVVVMLMGVKIDWSSLDPRPLSWQVTQAGTRLWSPSLQYTNLKAPNPQPLEPTNYSSSVEMVLRNTRTYTPNSPQRHIFHRGSQQFDSTTGLPARMNPGVILDNNLNDLLIYVDTVLGAEIYRESVRIVDVPMDIPLRLEIVVKGQVLEVYVNCKLEITKVLSGVPYGVENDWYGLMGANAAQAQIQNLYVWDRALTSREIATICTSGLPTFPTERAVCESAGATGAVTAALAR